MMADFSLPRDLPVGVYRTRYGKYTASIAKWGSRGKLQRHLGTFNSIEEALAARKKAEIEQKENAT